MECSIYVKQVEKHNLLETLDTKYSTETWETIQRIQDQWEPSRLNPVERLYHVQCCCCLANSLDIYGVGVVTVVTRLS